MTIYKCQKCNKEFSRINTYEYHINKKVCSKPFVCTFCEKCYKTTGSLKKHQYTICEKRKEYLGRVVPKKNKSIKNSKDNKINNSIDSSKDDEIKNLINNSIDDKIKNLINNSKDDEIKNYFKNNNNNNILFNKDPGINIKKIESLNVNLNGSINLEEHVNVNIGDLYKIFNKKFNKILTSKEILAEYNNFDIFNKLTQLINGGSKISIDEYNDEHCIYLFLCINNENEHDCLVPFNEPILKIGYTCGITKRIKCIEKELKCQVFLIDIKIVKNKAFEEKYHTNLKQLQPNLHYPLRVKNRKKKNIITTTHILLNHFQK